MIYTKGPKTSSFTENLSFRGSVRNRRHSIPRQARPSELGVREGLQRLSTLRPSLGFRSRELAWLCRIRFAHLARGPRSRGDLEQNRSSNYARSKPARADLNLTSLYPIPIYCEGTLQPS